MIADRQERAPVANISCRSQTTTNLEEFRHWTKRFIEIDLEPSGSPKGVTSDARFFDVGRVRFNDSRLSGVHQSRSRKLVKRSEPSVAWIRMCRAGSNQMVFGGSVFPFVPGAIQLGDYSQEMHAFADDLWHVGATVPLDLIGFEPGRRHPPVINFDPNGPLGRILRASLDSHLEQLPRATEREALALADSFCGMLRGLLDGAADTLSETDVRQSRKSAMRSFLETRLTDPTLGPKKLAREFGMSRAAIYRDFAVDGGVCAYMLSRRLARAHDELCAHPGARGLVSRIAEKWGFSSVNHFSRKFQETYGCRPSTVIGSKALFVAEKTPDASRRTETEATGASVAIASISPDKT